jgi:sec-independent protein translocase protein TatC
MAQNQIEYDGPEDDKEQTLVAHLVELRTRIVRSAIAILLVFACLSPFMKQIFDYLSQPLMVALPQGAKLLAIGVIAPFMVPLKVTLFVAFVIALPYVLYQLWAFIAPGLYRKEKRLAIPIIVSSLIMFFLGMMYCYFIVFKMVFQFISNFAPDSVNFAPDIDSYFSFVLALFLAFGLTFEVPIVVVVLNRMGITDIEKLKKARPYMVVGAFVLAAIFTPPDILSQMLLAVPLVILYQVGIWLCAIFGRAKDTESESE